MLKAELISTGNELLHGELQDTNTAWIAEELTGRNIQIVRHTTVGDDIEQLTKLLRECGAKNHIALVTGGLGPTSDDITAQAAAKAADTSLELNSRAMEQIQSFFHRIGLEMPDSNEKQAMLPMGSKLIENPIGSAPGFFVNIEKCMCFFLPGVPREMRVMLEQSVMPRINEKFGLTAEKPGKSKLRIFGLGESQVQARLEDFSQEFPGIVLEYRALFPELQLTLRPSEANQANQVQDLLHAEEWIISLLGNAVFSREGEEMEEVIGRLLTSKEESLAIAESCTGGRISHLVTNISGSSQYFLFSGVTYTNQSKIKLLGVSPDTLENHGAVSEQTAREMAAGIRDISGATYGVSTSGIAGPSGGTPEKPVGTVCIGIADSDDSTASKHKFNFDSRTMNKKIFAFLALDALRRRIQRDLAGA